jgi:hypothetical protein
MAPGRIIITVVCLLSIGKGFGQTTFQKTYGETVPDEGYSVQQTSDGGYIIAGGGINYGVYLIKTDGNGDTLWTKTFASEVGNFVQQTVDGGYIIVGRTVSGNNYDCYLIKTDAAGDTIWTKSYGGINDDTGTSVQQTADGGYIISGQTGVLNSFDAYLIQTKPDGNILWSKTFGGTSTDYATSVLETTDGGFIVTGLTSSFGAGLADVYLIRTDMDGDTLWTRTFGGTGNDYASCIKQTNDGGYILTGVTRSFGAGNDDVYLIKTDSLGNALWTKTFGGAGYEMGNSVQQTTDGGYIVVGFTSSCGACNKDVYLIKTNAGGNLIWSKTFGGTDDDNGFSVQQTTDGGYIIAGQTFSFGVGNGTCDVYLIKTDSLGNSGCHQANAATIVTTPTPIVKRPATIITNPVMTVTTPAAVVGSGGVINTLCITVGIQPECSNSKSVIVIFPNPTSGFFSIQSSLKNGHFEIFNSIGEEIYSEKISGTISKKEINLNAAAGIYFVKVNDGEKEFTQKLIIQ